MVALLTKCCPSLSAPLFLASVVPLLPTLWVTLTLNIGKSERERERERERGGSGNSNQNDSGKKGIDVCGKINRDIHLAELADS